MTIHILARDFFFFIYAADLFWRKCRFYRKLLKIWLLLWPFSTSILQLDHIGKTGLFRKIRIKFEVDTNPLSGSKNEIKYLDFPFVSSVTVQDKPSLFAGKLHALLCREYIKGRDWYDFLWYTGQGIKINYSFLGLALKQQGPWKGIDIDVDLKRCRDELRKKIKSVDWKTTTEDVRRFVRVAGQPSLDLWGKDLFLAQLEKLKWYCLGNTLIFYK